MALIELGGGSVCVGLCRHTSARYGAWRIDGFILSEQLAPKVVSADIRHSVFKEFAIASDHWPSVIDYKGEL